MNNLKAFHYWLRNTGFQYVKQNDFTLATLRQQKMMYYSFVEDGKTYLCVGDKRIIFRFNKLGRLLGMKA